MIVLDAFVISETWRPAPDPYAVAWLDAQHLETLYLTTVTLAEIRYGIAALPDGHRRDVLRGRFEEETFPLFAGRILPFDEPASAAYGDLQARARERGAALGALYAQIAAICLSRRFALATRNTRDFRVTSLALIDPWEVRARR